jgi:hypothetical protein
MTIYQLNSKKLVGSSHPLHLLAYSKVWTLFLIIIQTISRHCTGVEESKRVFDIDRIKSY